MEEPVNAIRADNAIGVEKGRFLVTDRLKSSVLHKNPEEGGFC